REAATPAPTVAELPPVDDAGRLVVMLDPGHGGVDPGAVRGDHTEANLVLTFARELRDALRRTGRVEVVLTRDSDLFVPLPTRVTLARAAGADLFVSLHADALAEGVARGATIYTLSETASDAAAEALAEQHDRADLLQGIDLHGADDVVAGVLMDLARLETAPRSVALADTLVDEIGESDLTLHSRPHGEAGFTVLRAADIPSVLLEIGFMSDAQDLENILDPEWRARMQAALVEGILDWADADAARMALVRQ
ncbi:N-acetylmuramoyl-L-alanine amidase, partial [Rhodobacterales bacterium HKCCSP123]|nr:N-acetylmuramoyl-L-alanine amidase [Rhodobacterales bacterium HKCCSP123]